MARKQKTLREIVESGARIQLPRMRDRFSDQEWAVYQRDGIAGLRHLMDVSRPVSDDAEIRELWLECKRVFYRWREIGQLLDPFRCPPGREGLCDQFDVMGELAKFDEACARYKAAVSLQTGDEPGSIRLPHSETPSQIARWRAEARLEAEQLIAAWEREHPDYGARADGGTLA